MLNKYKFLGLILILSAFTLKAQNPQWIDILTDEAGLADERASRIYVNDINGDDYPDIIYAGPTAYKEPLTLLINEPNPDQNSPYSRIFTDKTEGSNINATRHEDIDERWSDVTVIGDIDNDGDNDLVTSVFFYSLKEYIKRDTIEVSDGQGGTKDSVAVFIDPYQHMEVLLNDGNGNFTIKENNGLTDHQFIEGKYSEHNLEYPPGLLSTTGMSLIDVDKDGNLDLVIGTFMTDYDRNQKMYEVLMKGNGDGSFSYVPNSGLEEEQEPLYGLNSTDYNNDGWMDVVSSPYCRSDGSLWENMQDGTFNDVAQMVNYSANHMERDDNPNGNLCQWEAMPADFDNDGDMDLLQVLVHGGYDEGKGRTTIAVNQGEEGLYKFEWEIDRLKREAPEYSHLGDMGANWFDLNNDGWQDVAIGQMSYPKANVHGQERLYVLLQNDEHYFDDISHEIGIFETMKEAHSMEPIDYDLDGDNDLVFNRRFRDTIQEGGEEKRIKHMKLYIMHNNIGDSASWSSVKLKSAPQGSNRSNIGARIKVHSGDLHQIREILAGNGHFGGQDPFIKNFGLGGRNRIDSVEIFWQSIQKPRTVIYNPPIDLILEIGETQDITWKKDWEGTTGITHFKDSYTEFDTVFVGESISKTVTITNIGEADLMIDSVALVNDEAGNYSLDASGLTPGTSLTKDEEITVDVTFTPQDRGRFISHLKIYSDSKHISEKLYDLEGFGINSEPVLYADNKEIEFSETFVDTSSYDVLNLKNIGYGALFVDSVSVTAGAEVFSIDVPEILEDSLQSEEDVDIIVTFAPQNANEYTGEIKIYSNSYGSNVQTVSLQGKGKDRKPDININNTKIGYFAVEIGEEKTRDFEIANDGDGELEIQEFIYKDNTDDAFRVIGDDELPKFIKPGRNHYFTMVFAPEQEMKYEAEMTIVSNDYTNDRPTVLLTGIGRKGSSVRGYETSAYGIKMKAYPNPFANYINVNIITDEMLANQGKLYFINAMGVKVKSMTESISKGESQVNTAGLIPGMYYIVYEAGDKILKLPVVKAE